MTVVMNTCWAYRDAWVPFAKLFHKYWPTCPYYLAMVTDRMEQDPGGFDLILSHDRDYGWCGNLDVAVNRWLQTDDYVFLFQEDFFLSSYVDEEFVKYAVDFMERDKSVGCFRLYPCPGPNPGHPVDGHPDVGLIGEDEPYRISCQSAIWRTEYLSNILERCVTPADFEIKGSPLSKLFSDKVVSVRRERQRWPLEYLCTAIVRGEWTRDAIRFCNDQGIKIFSERPVQGG